MLDGRERPDPNRGGACFSTLDNPLVDIPAKELQAAYTRALDAGAKPTDGPSFDPFNLNPKPAPETTSSSKKAPSTSSPAPEPTPEEPAPDPENEETTASISPSPSTTTSHTPAKTSDSAFQGGRSDEDDDEDNRENSTGTFDLTSPLATETFSSPGGYLGGSSDSTLQETSNNGLSTGALAGAVVAGVVGGLLIAVGIFFLLRRKKHQKRALNGGGPNGEMIDESNEPRASDPTNTNPNHPLEIMGVTLMFKKPKNQPITFGSDAESITDIAPTSQTSRASHSQSPSRTELGAAVPVEAQSAPVVELSASKSQRWRTE